MVQDTGSLSFFVNKKKRHLRLVPQPVLALGVLTTTWFGGRGRLIREFSFVAALSLGT